MIRINLGKEQNTQAEKKTSLTSVKLPPQLQKAIKQASEDLGLVVFYVVALAVAALPQFVVTEYIELVTTRHKATLSDLDKKIAEIDTEIVKYSPFKKELESFEAQKAMVKERLTTIRKLQGGRGMPVTLMDAISQSLPKRVWLGDIRLTNSSEDAALALTGSALANEDISDFVDKLQDSVHFETVKLLGVSPSKLGQVSTKSFTIEIKSKPVTVDVDDPEIAVKP
jgi:Tfp pilus assembly protein PilN